MQKAQKLQPNLDLQATKELNLTVLRRVDADVEEILTTAGHVTLYEFDVDEKQWDRKDVEGSLFVVKRRSQPRFQFIVMNRRNTDNLVEDLLGDFEYEVQVPYLLYRNENQEVNGIWFYNPRECEDVANLFTRILSAFCKTPPKPKLFQPQGPDFQELEPNLATSAAIEAPWEHTVADIPPPQVSDEGEEDPLDRFFQPVRAAMHTPEPVLPSSRPPSGQPFVPTAPIPLPPLLSRSTSSQSIISLLAAAAQQQQQQHLHHQQQQHQHPPPTPPLPPGPPLPPPRPSSPSIDFSSSEVSSTTTPPPLGATLIKPSFFSQASAASSSANAASRVNEFGGSSSGGTKFVANNPQLPAAVLMLPSATGSAEGPLLQPSHGARLLQPFPPPTPPPSLTPANPPPHAAGGAVICRENVRSALLRLVQNDRFVDMVYEEMLMAHST